MLGITFLNQLYLGALLLGALPILIHLIRRRRVAVVRWAAWDFLLQSKRRNRRRLRLEQLLLLLLRILIVLLAVLAFCRPLIRTMALPLVAEDARVHALIVLDNSYSMGFTRGGVSDFDRARRVAETVMGKVLKPGDSVSVVLMSSQPAALIKEPTFSLSKARERLRSVRLSDRDTDYGATAELCATLLRGVKTPTREVYWLTDNQKGAFAEGNDQRGRRAWKELGDLARLTWVNVASGERENLSLEAPVFSRELVTPQAPVRVESVVHNYSSRSRRSLLVNMVVDGNTVGTSTVDVPAGGKAGVSFIHLFETPGVHTGRLEIGEPDGLAKDNRAYFALRVRERLRVLIVNPHPSTDPARDEAFYLNTALSPVGASEGGSTAIVPILRPTARLVGSDLRSFDAVVITGLTDLAPADVKALEEFVRNGGGALLFPGPGTEAGRLNAQPFLPARLGARRLYTEETGPSLNAATIGHPALATFRDTSEINLGSARFTQLFELQPAANDPSVRVMCRFSGGQPAFVERRVGQGKVILAASSAGVTGNTLPYKPAYVPLVHQLVSYAAAGPAAQHNIALGETFSTRLDVKDAGKPVQLTDPGGQVSQQRSTLGADGVSFAFAGASQAGIYRVGIGGRAQADAFAVNLPARESDLSQVSDREVQARTGAGRLQFAAGDANLVAAVRHARHGTEVWRSLMLAVLPLLFVEGLLAQRFGRRG